MTKTLAINGSVHYFQWDPESSQIIESVGTGSVCVGYANTEEEFQHWFEDMLKENTDMTL